MSTRLSFGKWFLSAILALLLAGCSLGPIFLPPTPTPNPSRRPDPNEVKALLVQMVDVEKRAPGIVVLANASVDIDYAAPLLIGRLPFTLIQYAPKDLASYAGRYPLPDGSIVKIRVDGTRIFIQLPDEPDYELFASSEDHFFLPVSDLEITF